MWCSVKVLSMWMVIGTVRLPLTVFFFVFFFFLVFFLSTFQWSTMVTPIALADNLRHMIDSVSQAN